MLYVDSRSLLRRTTKLKTETLHCSFGATNFGHPIANDAVQGPQMALQHISNFLLKGGVERRVLRNLCFSYVISFYILDRHKYLDKIHCEDIT